MKVNSPHIQLAQNIIKGKIAEEIAIKDYQSHGYRVVKTGIGSDFKAIKLGSRPPYQEHVDVKAGNARLSKRQIHTRNKLKRQGKKYFVYRVSDQYIQSQLALMGLDNFHGIFLIKDPTQCPNCKKTASGLSNIVREFGLRNMGCEVVRVQSWCKKCRNFGKDMI